MTTKPREWIAGDHAEVGGLPVELLHMEGSLWRCARIFPKDDAPRTLLVAEALMHPFETTTSPEVDT